ncbi:MAG: hypothetical protein II919_00110 [Lachnospiraceae bacterium]|nr:hypothetical protein [Lachnospiraceae bacterium]
MFNSYDEKRYESFQKLLGKNDGEKNINICLKKELVDRIDMLAMRASKFSGNDITRNAIMEEGILIYVDEFEEYINHLYENYEDSTKYIEDNMKLTDKRKDTKMIEEKNDDDQVDIN